MNEDAVVRDNGRQKNGPGAKEHELIIQRRIRSSDIQVGNGKVYGEVHK